MLLGSISLCYSGHGHGLNTRLLKVWFKGCMKYISTSVWLLRGPNAGQNLLFQRCWAKKFKNRRKRKKIEAKFCNKQQVYEKTQ